MNTAGDDRSAHEHTRALGVPPALTEALSLSTILCDIPTLVAVAPDSLTSAGQWMLHPLGAAGRSVELSSHREGIIALARRACDSTGGDADRIQGSTASQAATRATSRGVPGTIGGATGGGVVTQGEWVAIPWAGDRRYGAVVLRQRAGAMAEVEALDAVRRAIKALLCSACESRALDALGEGMLCARDGGVIAVATERAAALLGLPRTRLEGRTLDAVLGERCGVLIAFDRLELAEQIRLRATTADGDEIALSASRRLAPDGAPDGIVVRITPASAIAPVALRRDRQVAAIRHEIRAPLTVLRGVTSMMREEPDMPLADRMTFLASLERETGRVITLVEDLLTEARLHAGAALNRKTSVDLVGWARALADTYRDWCADHDHAIETRLPTAPLAVLADRGLLDSLGRAVLGHIFKAAPPSTRVLLSIAAEGGGRARVRWSDDSPPLSEEDTRQLFTSFRRSTSAGKHAPGGGVGLPIAKGIADAHGWGMGYDRDAAGRNTLWLRVPLNQT